MDCTYHVTWSRHRGRNKLDSGTLADLASPQEARRMVGTLRAAGRNKLFEQLGARPPARQEIRIQAIERDPLAGRFGTQVLDEWIIPPARAKRPRPKAR